MLASVLDGFNEGDPANSAGAATTGSGKVKDDGSVKNGANMGVCLGAMEMCYGDTGFLLAMPRQGLGNAAIAAVANDEQLERFKGKWAAMAITEPSCGSDSAAIRATAKKDGDGYLINGQKTFISNGSQANLICVVTKTDTSAGNKGVSLMMVETDKVEGFRRGRILDKVGCEAADTSELFFEDVRVSADNLLGGVEGKGFGQLMAELPKERLIIALQSIYAIDEALAATIEYTKDRKLFGQTVMDFQNTQFKLAECKTLGTVTAVFVFHCLDLLLQGKLDNNMSAMAKLYASESQGKIIDECLQLFGGYGYINEYPIARLYRDARGQRLWGGTSEIMKVLIARSL